MMNEPINESSLDADNAAALEVYHFSLSHVCPENRPIKISSYPGSGRIVTVMVCNECYHLWADDDLSEALK